MPRRRVAIIGAGTAGCVLAGRLSRSEDLDVVLIESGPSPDLPPLRRRPRPIWTIEEAFDPSSSRRWDPGDGSPPLAMGRGVGGSGRVNGGYFIRPTSEDLTRWSRLLGDHGWGGRLLEAMIRSETDLDHPDSPIHGRHGLVPVSRDDTPLHPVSEAFAEAAATIGIGQHPDMNDGYAEGIGPVPFNSRSGRLFDTATAYLAPSLDRPNLTLLTGHHVQRLELRGRRVEAVVVTPGDRSERSATLAVDEVVLCAGTLGSPAILSASGIGGADHPAVGRGFHNDPVVDLTYLPRPAVSAASGPEDSFMQLVAHTTTEGTGGVDAEFMATRRPYGVVSGTDPADDRLSLRVTLLRAPSPADHQKGMDRAVRLGVELMSTGPFRDVLEHGPDGVVMSSSVAFHMSGSCPMGTDPTTSVVDPTFRVHGVEGLRIVDASVIPLPISRGPSACVVGLAEMASTAILGVDRNA